jgi:hypothetical protein
MNSTKPLPAFVIGGVYNTTPPVLADKQADSLEVDASGNLKVNVVAGGVGGGPVDITQIGGVPEALSNPLPVELSDGTQSVGTAGNPLSVNVVGGSIVAANASVGTDNATAPTSATEIGTIDGSGKLQGASVTNPVPVALPTGTVTTLTPPTAAAIGAACPVPPTASDIAAAIVSNPPTVGIAAVQKIEVYDGTNTATVKAASSQSATTDTSLVVQINPEQPNLTTALNVHDASPVAISIASAQKIEVYDGTNTAAVKAGSTVAADTDTSLVVQLNPKQPNLDTALNVHDASPSAVSIASAQKIEVYDGTNTAAVKAASTAAVDTDPALVVQINPKQPNLDTALNVAAAATLASETTKVIGTVRVLGSAGAIVDAATGATVPANAVQVGGIGKTALPTAVSDGQLVAPMTDKYGRQVVVLGTVRDLVGYASVQTTDTGAHNLIAAGGTGVYNDLISLAITNETATATVVSLSDGTTTYKFALAANGGVVLQWNSTLPAASAATAWTVTSSATVTLDFVVTYAKNK